MRSAPTSQRPLHLHRHPRKRMQPHNHAHHTHMNAALSRRNPTDTRNLLELHPNSSTIQSLSQEGTKDRCHTVPCASGSASTIHRAASRPTWRNLSERWSYERLRCHKEVPPHPLAATQLATTRNRLHHHVELHSKPIRPRQAPQPRRHGDLFRLARFRRPQQAPKGLEVRASKLGACGIKCSRTTTCAARCSAESPYPKPHTHLAHASASCRMRRWEVGPPTHQRNTAQPIEGWWRATVRSAARHTSATSASSAIAPARSLRSQTAPERQQALPIARALAVAIPAIPMLAKKPLPLSP